MYLELEPPCGRPIAYCCPECGEEAVLNKFHQIECALCEIWSEVPDPDFDWYEEDAYVC